MQGPCVGELGLNVLPATEPERQNLLQIWTEKAEPGAALLCLPSTQRGCSASPAAPDPPHLSPELVSAAPNLAQLKTLAAALHRCTLRGKCCLFVLRSSLDTCKQACILLNASVVMSSYVINISSIPMLDWYTVNEQCQMTTEIR